jgi:preprotein translocase subunit SecD
VVGDGWSTVGGCTGRFAGDGGPAVEASLSWPVSVAVAEDGTIYLADRLNCRIRKITPGPPSQRPRDARIVLQGRLGMGMTAEAIAELERIVRQRAKALGLKDLSVRNEGDTLIVVTFRPVRAFGHVVRALSARGNLDFRSVPDKYQPVIEPSRILLRGPDHKSVPAEEALKDREPIVKREDLLTKASTSVDPDTGQPVLRVYLSDAAEQAVALWFQQHRKSYLAVVFDGRVISVAQLPSAIRQYANVAGIFRSAEAQTIVACLKTDPLPIKVIVREQRRGVVSHGE